MIIRSRKSINTRGLAWEIRKATGVNLGGYNETQGIPQTGSIRYSDADGVVIECPDAKATQIQAILDSHDLNAPMPADVPADPVISPVKPLGQQYAEATTDAERLEILAKAAGLM